MSRYLIPDDPIVRCMEQTGRPPWEVRATRIWSPFSECQEYDDEWEDETDDVFYGSETEDF